MTGTADPNSTVQLWETAIGWDDMQPAKDWTSPGETGPVLATADGSGNFSIRRFVDSGFLFQVRQGSVISNTITVKAKLAVKFWMPDPQPHAVTAGKLTVMGDALPAQPGLPVQIQRRPLDGTTWTTVRTTKTAGETAKFTETLTGQPGGDHYWRAVFSGDDSQGVIGTTSGEVKYWTPGGSTTTPPTTTPPTTRPPTTPPTTKPPTTPPTTKPPTTTKPPAPATPAIQFTRIQYDPPGTDSGSNGSLLNEYFKITNMTKKAININGWTVRDGKGIVYRFPNININVGQSYLVRTGKGKDSGSFRHWGRAGKAGYVWDNLGDIAYLRNPAGGNVDICKWTKLGPGYTNC
ncbi:lamin tail domain-containing protein [Actinoplanes sp. TRM 88003]|uniref:Lamin tail domain-containing protein n=1 Tax=Paractinoplanes aksuensis TaxID=2939490 RepID=A0ABT1DN30_9ACTN|nr:lamin tail domain-containing protein [Actinoplanes aksuensis]MCO8272254.1 lamin tail domain-containing protein [Actinoplanes aksuensis]